jgi:hypothetical protein
MNKLEKIYTKSIERGHIKKEIASNIRQSSVTIYLEKIFNAPYPKWKFDLNNFGAEYFINTTTHIHKNNQLIIDSICAYRSLQFKDFGTLKYEFEGITDIRENIDIPIEENISNEIPNIISNIESNKTKTPIINLNSKVCSYKEFFQKTKEDQLKIMNIIEEIPEDQRDINEKSIYNQGKRIGIFN